MHLSQCFFYSSRSKKKFHTYRFVRYLSNLLVLGLQGVCVVFFFQVDETANLATDKINNLLESFMGINDTELCKSLTNPTMIPCKISGFFFSNFSIFCFRCLKLFPLYFSSIYLGYRLYEEQPTWICSCPWRVRNRWLWFLRWPCIWPLGSHLRRKARPPGKNNRIRGTILKVHNRQYYDVLLFCVFFLKRCIPPSSSHPPPPYLRLDVVVGCY